MKGEITLGWAVELVVEYIVLSFKERYRLDE